MKPRLDMLPPEQRRLWPELSQEMPTSHRVKAIQRIALSLSG